MKRRIAILTAVFLLFAALGTVIWLYARSEKRVYVNGVDITLLRDSGYTMDVGEGSAAYDPATRTLTLTDTDVTKSARGAAVYAAGDLTIVFSGENILTGKLYGIYCKGELSLRGEGAASFSGGKYGVYARGTILIPEYCSIDAQGESGAIFSAEGTTWDHLYLAEDGDGNRLTGDCAVPHAILRAPVRLEYVTYGGGDLPMAAFQYGTDHLELARPVREGFVFKGWYTSRDYEDSFDASAPILADVKIHALWDKYADRVLTGIDVSGHQGEIDWQAVADAGVEFAVIRAGFRGYGETGSLNADEYFAANLEGAAANGIPAGVYFYSQAISVAEAEAEAEFVLEALGGNKITLPVFFDVEYAEDSGGYIGRLYDAALSPEEQAEICATFCNKMEKAGHNAMVYANFRMLSGGLGAILDEQGIGVWLAHWREHTYYDCNYDYWQYSSSGTVDGITGGVDMNRWYVVLDGLFDPGILPTEKAVIEGVTGAFHSEGIALISKITSESHVEDLTALGAGDALDEALTEDLTALDILLPSERTDNDLLFYRVLSSIRSDAADAITKDVAGEDGSDERWAAIRDTVDKLRQARSAADLTALLDE